MTRRDFVRRGALWLPAAAAMGQQILVVKKKAVGGGGPLTDDFNRANGALGSNWSVDSGSVTIASNAAVMSGGSWVYNVAAHNTALSTVNQYMLVAFPAGTADYPQLIFRYTNISSAFYMIEVDATNGICKFFHYLSGTTTQIGGDAGTGGTGISGVSFGFTLYNTGASTTLRIWRAPTGTAPDSGSNGALWGGASPTATIATNPGGSAVDTGLKVGIGGQNGTANNAKIDTWYAGDLP
jgi:hypothetical protein